ncbi:hypothetical protein G7Y89_g7906 [Cudoniella acicularis]|uniref:MHYT domain-containing protein n=1 Tax=Cudoniella acicularis TaxID=354080 RepID=A0A8H4W436_9HELO|nr:hypothetical protein G7Y89_g7906 [Cudoniella acicularis]
MSSLSHNTMPQNYTMLVGNIVPRTFNPGYVVLSYLISYVGAWTAIELINKRTTMKGSYNWFLLIGAALSMGGIATWCMHFIGNRAIILGDGGAGIQISYSPGFTALSFFVPIIVLLLAFWTVGSNEILSLARVSMGGTLAGLGFSGMHYLGQAGISNYTCVYQVAFVISATIIACLASIGAIGMFFFYRSAWNSTWWKRAISAFVLSVGVSGMHWLAMVGTLYRLKKVDPSLGNSKSTTVIVTIVLSVIGSLALVLLSVIAQAQRARAANRAQQVVLATAFFDNDGKIMVTSQGLLPNKKITNQYLERSFNDVFNASHPVFLWIYRTTYHWPGVTGLVPAMQNHLERAGLRHQHIRSRSQANLLNEEGTPIEDYSIIFRELFCVAAADLASNFKIPKEDLGLLFNEIVATGNKSKQDLKGGKSVFSAAASTVADRKPLKTKNDDVPVLGKGQLLFLVKRVDRREAEGLQAAGYRFATKENVLPILAQSLQIGHTDISRRLDLMLDYATDSTHMLEPGIHIACFAIRASIGAGFDVLARKDAKNQLPTMQLPFDTIEPWQIEYLNGMNLLSVVASMKLMNKASKANNPSPTQREFAKNMMLALKAIKDEIEDPFFNDAQLIAEPIEVPCRGQTKDSPPGTALLITYKIIVPIHARAPGKKLEFTPLNLFRMQQRVYKNSADHAVFARETFREFARVLDLTEPPNSGQGKLSTWSKLSFGKKDGNAPSSPGMTLEGRIGDDVDMFGNQLVKKVRGDNSSEKDLMDVESQPAFNSSILVSQDVSIDPRTIDSNRPRSPASNKGGAGQGIEMNNLPGNQKPGVTTQVSKEQGELKTFVDEMFAITIKTKGGAKLHPGVLILVEPLKLEKHGLPALNALVPIQKPNSTTPHPFRNQQAPSASSQHSAPKKSALNFILNPVDEQRKTATSTFTAANRPSITTAHVANVSNSTTIPVPKKQKTSTLPQGPVPKRNALNIQGLAQAPKKQPTSTLTAVNVSKPNIDRGSKKQNAFSAPVQYSGPKKNALNIFPALQELKKHTLYTSTPVKRQIPTTSPAPKKCKPSIAPSQGSTPVKYPPNALAPVKQPKKRKLNASTTVGNQNPTPKKRKTLPAQSKVHTSATINEQEPMTADVPVKQKSSPPLPQSLSTSSFTSTLNNERNSAIVHIPKKQKVSPPRPQSPPSNKHVLSNLVLVCEKNSSTDHTSGDISPVSSGATAPLTAPLVTAFPLTAAPLMPQNSASREIPWIFLLLLTPSTEISCPNHKSLRPEPMKILGAFKTVEDANLMAGALQVNVIRRKEKCRVGYEIEVGYLNGEEEEGGGGKWWRITWNACDEGKDESIRALEVAVVRRKVCRAGLLKDIEEKLFSGVEI